MHRAQLPDVYKRQVNDKVQSFQPPVGSRIHEVHHSDSILLYIRNDVEMCIRDRSISTLSANGLMFIVSFVLYVIQFIIMVMLLYTSDKELTKTVPKGKAVRLADKC